MTGFYKMTEPEFENLAKRVARAMKKIGIVQATELLKTDPMISKEDKELVAAYANRKIIQDKELH